MNSKCRNLDDDRLQTSGTAGFGLAEFLISTLIMLVLTAAVFTLMTSMQSSAGYQSEVQSVLTNTRVAMETIERYAFQAGNNPSGAALIPITNTSSTEVRFQSDITGSAGTGLGDPDGNIDDPDEDVIIRYNSTAKSIELVLPDASVQTIANYISAFSIQYLDASGAATTTAADIRMIRVAISGQSTLSDPRTRKTFGISLASDFRMQNMM